MTISDVARILECGFMALSFMAGFLAGLWIL